MAIRLASIFKSKVIYIIIKIATGAIIII